VLSRDTGGMVEPIPVRASQTVRLADGNLRIDGLTVTDSATVAAAEALAEDERERFVLDALSVGVRVLGRERAGQAADHVRGVLEAATERVERTLADQTRGLSDELGVQLAKHFADGSTDAVQHRVRALVEKALTESGVEMSNALAELRAEVRAERDLRSAVASERERGAGKGRTFEQDVADRLDLIANAQGDVCEHTGDALGSGGGKAGDVVISIDAARGPSRGRVVFECKDTTLSRPAALAELDAARAVRDADFAVLVVARAEQLPARMHLLREYGGDKLVVAYDALEPAAEHVLQSAYSLARARVLADVHDATALDTEAVRQAVERIAGAVDDARKVKLALTGADKSIEAARAGVEIMAGRVRDHVAGLQALLGIEPQQPALKVRGSRRPARVQDQSPQVRNRGSGHPEAVIAAE